MPVAPTTQDLNFYLNRMLNRVKAIHPNVDTREGSVAYDACAACAYELVQAYDTANNYYNETNIETASRTGKYEKCRDQGIDTSIFDAHAGVFRGEFNVEVNIGSRWNCDLFNYVVTEFIEQSDSTQYYEYALTCETVGTAPNDVTGELTPIDNPPRGLSHAALTGDIVPGENETPDDEIVEYYYDYISRKASDGNVAQYEQWAREYPGIGNFHVFPLWNGPNTVKVSILDANNDAADEELIAEFQEYLDPNSSGMGDGVAPIGAIVTVDTAEELQINVSAKVSLKDGTVSTSSIQPALEEYFGSIAYQSTLVSYIAVASTILNAQGIANVTDVLVNNGTEDITLDDEQIPVLGTLDITTIT